MPGEDGKPAGRGVIIPISQARRARQATAETPEGLPPAAGSEGATPPPSPQGPLGKGAIPGLERSMPSDRSDAPPPLTPSGLPPPHAGRPKGTGPRMTKAQKEATELNRQGILLELAKSGATFRQIAQQLGYSGAGAAYNAFQTALRDARRPSADEALGIMLDRFDGWLFALATKARAGDVGAIGLSLNIEAQRARLLGLNAPVAARLDIEVRIREMAARLGLDPDQAVQTAAEIMEARRSLGAGAMPSILQGLGPEITEAEFAPRSGAQGEE